ncbi:hypothetical protein [Fimbriiglobus ruber]|uniref:Zinc-ribbon domain-containing protein n=1 Tax=Fimbriiglobus ruber TaxID=1908690 RepID=A0A225DZU8_9BACT|nr:hypothetical protein [Fimbriiglobus ruber]OWK47030.1 hypothetical protein FRUB_00729 [Fimbriiglobus ruber]
MSNRVDCQHCGARVNLPAGFSRAKIRCPGCGYYADVPPESRSAAPVDEAESSPEPPPTRKPKPAAVQPTPFSGKTTKSEAYDPEADEAFGLAEAPTRPPTTAPKPTRPERTSKPVKVKPQLDARDPRPRFEAEDEPTGKPLLEGTQDEDDDRPYGVPGAALITCPHCRSQLPIGSEFCVHCGREIASSEKAPRVFQPIEGEWEEGWNFLTRLKIYAGLQVLNFFGTMASILKDGWTGLTTLLLFQAFHVTLMTFLVGSYDTLTLRRNSKGNATLTRTRRMLFYNLPPQKVRWKDCSGIGVVGGQTAGIVEWFICFYLLLFGIVPGVVFYWMVIRPSRFVVHLCDEYGSTTEVIFHTKDRDQAVEVATLVSEATKLFYRPI